MRLRAILLVLAGAAATTVLAAASDIAHGPALVARLEAGAERALAASGSRGVSATFRDPRGWLTRHPSLVGGEALDPAARARAAQAVAAVPGVGGVRWRTASRTGAGGAGLHCQQDVEAILKTRTIRFAEASAAIDPGSANLLDEVARALRPCAGGVIAITGHTDAEGQEPANLALSLERARAVREALVARGIARADLRARGLGSKVPVTGLDPADPANRRIEFSVISPAPLDPTPVDTAGAG